MQISMCRIRNENTQWVAHFADLISWRLWQQEIRAIGDSSARPGKTGQVIHRRPNDLLVLGGGRQIKPQKIPVYLAIKGLLPFAWLTCGSKSSRTE
jgi:hypothetical protein